MPRKTRHNRLTDDASLAQVNTENKRLISDFLEYLRSTQRSESTISVYENDLEIAMVWCLKNNGNKPFVNWTKRELIRFQGWLINENKNSPARVRRIKATLSSLSNYICNVLDDEYPDFKNIIHKIESPVNQAVREKTVWSDDEVEGLLKELTALKEYKKACVVALAAYSGRRKAELCRFKVTDFEEKNLVCGGALYKTSAPIRTKGHGAGKYIYCYTLAKKFRPYLDGWMAERRRLGIESEWLFPDATDPQKQMSPGVMNSWTAQFSKICGKEVYMHSLRHAFVTYLVRAGLPDAVTQSLLGWTSADMVRVYTDIEAEEQIAMYFKDGGINVGQRKDVSSL